MATNWFYADAHNQQQGPVEGAWLANAYRAGTVRADTLVWREGLGNWVPLRQVAAQFGLIIVGGAAPPLPDRADSGKARIAKPRSGSSSVAIVVVVLVIGFVAVMGILAAIALPAYADYTTRAKVVEGAIAAEAVKIEVAEFYIANEHCPHEGDQGFSKPDFPNKYVSAIDVGVDKASGACAVQVTYANIPQVQGKHLRYLLQQDGSWHVSSDIPARYLSTSMRAKMD